MRNKCDQTRDCINLSQLLYLNSVSKGHGRTLEALVHSLPGPHTYTKPQEKRESQCSKEMGCSKCSKKTEPTNNILVTILTIGRNSDRDLRDPSTLPPALLLQVYQVNRIGKQEASLLQREKARQVSDKQETLKARAYRGVQTEKNMERKTSAGSGHGQSSQLTLPEAFV